MLRCVPSSQGAPAPSEAFGSPALGESWGGDSGTILAFDLFGGSSRRVEGGDCQREVYMCKHVYTFG